MGGYGMQPRGSWRLEGPQGLSSFGASDKKIDMIFIRTDEISNYEAASRLCHKANYEQTHQDFCSSLDEDLDTQD